MPRKWEYSRGAVCISVWDYGPTYWVAGSLIVRPDERWEWVTGENGGPGRYQKVMECYKWGETSRQNKHYHYQAGMATQEHAIRIAELMAENTGLPYLPHIKSGQRVLTLVDGLIAGLTAIGG